jgi:hypothetical protein
MRLSARTEAIDNSSEAKSRNDYQNVETLIFVSLFFVCDFGIRTLCFAG